MKSAPILACLILALTASQGVSQVSRDHMFRFCEHRNTMEVAQIGIDAIRSLGEELGSSYYRNVVKKVYERTADAEWRWIELAHERILEGIIYYREREGRFMVQLDKPFIMDSCKLAIPAR